MAEERKGFWASMALDPNVFASGLVDNTTTLTVYKDGTFTTRSAFGKESARDRLLGFEHDIDSMRRKSTTGRGAAALLTGGASLLASNNRGVVYVTVIGERSNVRTYTTRNPSGTTLSSIRSLKAAFDALAAQAAAAARTPAPAPPPAPVAAVPAAPTGPNIARQMQNLLDLHLAGALTAEEFAAAKARLLAD